MQLFSIASFIVCVASFPFGYGRHIKYVTPEDIIHFGLLKFIAQPLWVIGVTCIKISVAFMFLRIKRSFAWRAIMWFSILYLVASTVIIVTLQFTECRPLKATWNRSLPGTVCRSSDEVKAAVVGSSVVFVFSDFQFALLPLTFIFTLRRPLRERIALGFIMGLGLVASIVGCLKLIGINQRANPDKTWYLVPVKLGAFSEACVGIIAACAPALKARGEKVLKKMGYSLSGATRKSGNVDTSWGHFTFGGRLAPKLSESKTADIVEDNVVDKNDADIKR